MHRDSVLDLGAVAGFLLQLLLLPPFFNACGLNQSPPVPRDPLGHNTLEILSLSAGVQSMACHTPDTCLPHPIPHHAWLSSLCLSPSLPATLSRCPLSQDPIPRVAWKLWYLLTPFPEPCFLSNCAAAGETTGKCPWPGHHRHNCTISPLLAASACTCSAQALIHLNGCVNVSDEEETGQETNRSGHDGKRVGDDDHPREV